jgi:hypothetical protein
MAGFEVSVNGRRLVTEVEQTWSVERAVLQQWEVLGLGA